MKELSVKLHSIDDKVKFSAVSRENPEVVIDYFPPFGTGEGYTSLELLLASAASCVGTLLVTQLRGKMGRTISSLSINASGIQRDTHPMALTHIRLEYVITSPDAQDAEVQRVLAIADDKLCPVLAMLKGNVEIEKTYSIINPA